MRSYFIPFIAFVALSLGCKTYHRKNIYDLSPTDPVVLAYQKAVSVMKQRSPNDPTSWTYQANIHGTYDMGNQLAWNTCQHGSFYFLSWHRMYLYYFERIVRKASGYSDFALPYWDYSDVAAHAALPTVFRDPANSSNSLYEPNRGQGVNTGSPLQPSITDYSVAFADTNFTNTADDVGFGGQTVPMPEHFTGPHGLLESQPHDVVHDGLGGLMSDPNTAARDPIFYLHHANIDRLWVAWLARGGGRADPTGDSNWMNTVFTFFDENGNAVKMTGKDILNTDIQLNYVYDVLRVIKLPPIEYPLNLSPVPIDTSIKPMTLMTGSEKQTSGRRTEFALEVPSTPDSLENMRRNLKLLLRPTGNSRQKVILKLEGITFDTKPSGIFEVYINLPANLKPDYKSMYYAGNIGLFGFMMMHHGENSIAGGTVVLNITNTLHKLQDAGVDINALTVAVIHRGGTVDNDSTISGEIKIHAISVQGLNLSK